MLFRSPTTIILVGKHFSKIAEDLNAHYFLTSEEAKEWIQQNKPTDAAILIKGSRGSKMEKLMEAI